MNTPVWSLRDKDGKEIWSSYERDYPTAVEDALKAMGLEMVRCDLERCACCGLPNATCICERCETCG